MLRIMWRKLFRGLGCLSYLGVLGVLFGLISYLAFSLFIRRGDTPTPDLFGLAETEARALLADQGLTMSWTGDEDRFDEKVSTGHVLLQKPRAGTLVKRGSKVNAILSRGPQHIVVPSVLGEAPQAAQVTLAAAGLTLGRMLAIYSREGESGTVISQQPASGTALERGGRVDLFVSQGSSSATFLMPDLVYRHFDSVRNFFERRGFRLGRVGFEVYDGLTPGTVVRQFPLAGHPLRQGDVISLGVVAGSDKREGPSTVNPAAADPSGSDVASGDHG
jgi:serine/threonine-protein kinase